MDFSAPPQTQQDTKPRRAGSGASRTSSGPRSRRAGTTSSAGLSSEEGSGGDGSSHSQNGPRLYQTLTACNRCRSRKTRCDPGLPKCSPCERAGAPCEFYDANKGKTLSRKYVITLQQRARQLEEEVRRRVAQHAESDKPDDEDLVRSMNLVSLSDEEPEGHFMGASAGLQLTRLVVEHAKQNTETHSVKDIVPPSEHYPARKQNSTRRVSYPARSAHPASSLPGKATTEKLINEFIFQKSQFMLPTLHEPSFMSIVEDVYAGSRDAYKNFTVNLVLAIAMQKLGIQYSGLADSYYLAAMQHFEAVIMRMDLYTLQCLCLMGQYSLLTPTRTGSYHIIGLATRLTIDLGLNQEKSVTKGKGGVQLDPLEVDMRRRLFWVVSSMESGLSHILGRPSAFCNGDAYTDVEFYQPVDDIYITKSGILSGPPSPKKLVSMHFFRMRRIQYEIRRTLYQNPRPTPKCYQDPWFTEMYAKLDNWRQSAPGHGEKSGLSQEWFQHRYNNMLIFLYRPSPQIPKPSIEATIVCYNCAIENIHLQKKMFDRGASDVTWVHVHQVYMTCIIMMWCLSYDRIRELHSREEVERHIQCGLDCMQFMIERWPGVKSARDLFYRISKVALQSYEKSDSSASPISPANNAPPMPQNKPPVEPVKQTYHAAQQRKEQTRSPPHVNPTAPPPPPPSVGRQPSMVSIPSPLSIQGMVHPPMHNNSTSPQISPSLHQQQQQQQQQQNNLGGISFNTMYTPDMYTAMRNQSSSDSSMLQTPRGSISHSHTFSSPRSSSLTSSPPPQLSSIHENMASTQPPQLSPQYVMRNYSMVQNSGQALSSPPPHYGMNGGASISEIDPTSTDPTSMPSGMLPPFTSAPLVGGNMPPATTSAQANLWGAMGIQDFSNLGDVLSTGSAAQFPMFPPDIQDMYGQWPAGPDGSGDMAQPQNFAQGQYVSEMDMIGLAEQNALMANLESDYASPESMNNQQYY